MKIFLLHIFLIIILIQSNCYYTVNGNQAEVDSLVSVVSFSRHGDRTPEISYPKDTLNIKWPVGKGQLLNSGKKRMYKLGLWFRKYLSGFLPEAYSPKDIRIQALEKDRILMSAATALAALYPPKNDQIWNENLLWQPIPIYRLPEHLIYSAVSKNCPKYLNKCKSLVESSEYFNSQATKEFLEYIKNNTGIPADIDHLVHVGLVWDTLLVQQENNYTLPQWTDKIYPEEFSEFLFEVFAAYAFDHEMIRLSIGGFLNDLLDHFESFISTNKATNEKFKLKMFFGQDMNVVKILKALDSWENHIVDYGATVIFQLHQIDGEYFVRFYYLMELDELVPKRMGECPFNCPFNEFKDMLKKYVIPNQDVWHQECHSGVPEAKNKLVNTFMLALIIIIVLLLISDNLSRYML